VVGRIDEHGNAGRFGHKLMQNFQPFCHQLAGEEIDAGHVAGRPGEARNKTELHRILAGDEDNRDRRRCGLGHESHIVTGRPDYGDLTANQLGRQFRQSLDFILGEAVDDRHVLALDIAGLLETLAV